VSGGSRIRRSDATWQVKSDVGDGNECTHHQLGPLWLGRGSPERWRGGGLSAEWRLIAGSSVRSAARRARSASPAPATLLEAPGAGAGVYSNVGAANQGVPVTTSHSS